ncbi:uncharacterized protein M6B38_417665 [Iris pallida]|uniref:Uncharacterized protein n=1 Tax=Iris pallida TaxID=29817 RepID=A0AAX6FIW0_IRIPA|nr:uncharacterized protein M6B38_417665 [Iris pallida]
MEAIRCSFPSLPISSFLTTQHPTKGRAHLQCFLRRQTLLPSLSPPRPQALNEALNVATDVAAPKAIGGDISVLIPVSALLLFMYWVANFIVPGIVAKELQENGSEREEAVVSEQQTSAAPAANATAASEPPAGDKPKKKFKKEDIKKMMRR